MKWKRGRTNKFTSNSANKMANSTTTSSMTTGNMNYFAPNVLGGDASLDLSCNRMLKKQAACFGFKGAEQMGEYDENSSENENDDDETKDEEDDEDDDEEDEEDDDGDENDEDED